MYRGEFCQTEFPTPFVGREKELSRLEKAMDQAGAVLGPLAVVAICITLGTALAVTAAWRRGAADAVISSGLDILFAFPGILLAVLAAAVFGAGLLAASVATWFGAWVTWQRYRTLPRHLLRMPNQPPGGARSCAAVPARPSESPHAKETSAASDLRQLHTERGEFAS